MSLRIAMLSVHTCPLAALGGKETGGMNVYVRELARELSRMGAAVDVFTRSQNAAIPRVVRLADHARVIHLPAGPQAPMARERIHAHLDEFVDGIEAWRLTDGVEYDLLHGNYWLSGVVGLALRARWGVPLVQMFHTLGALKNGAGVAAEREPALRLAEERRIVAAADRLVAANAIGGEADEPAGGHEADVRRRAAALGLGDAVTFVGSQPQERLRDWYVAADITVSPSYYESFGMVALEAMACGSPVVASRVGGLQSTVRDGVTGLLVPEGDPCALAASITRVLGDGALRWRLGREGQRWAAQHRWPCGAEAICREYATLAEGVGDLATGRCV